MKALPKILLLSLLIAILFTGKLSGQVDTLSLSRELLMATYRNSMDSVILLLKKGAKTNYKDEFGQTPIFYAVQNNNLDMVKLLEFNNANLNSKNYEGTTPLSSATWFGFFDIAEYLCYKGALTNLYDRYGAIPLHYAAFLGDYFMADMLLFYKSDANSTSYDKNTPLHLAALSGDTAMIRLLLKHEAKPNSKNLNGLTPIEIAIEHKHLYATLLLLKSDSVSEVLNPENSALLNLSFQVDADTIADSIMAMKRYIPPRKNDASNPYNVALTMGKYEMKKSLKKYGYSSGLWPFFSKISVMNTFLFNKDDHFFGFQVGWLDVKYHLDISLGFGSRFSRRPIMVSIDKNTLYQLHERRNIFDLGIKKRFYFSPKDRTVSLFTGIDLQAHFGNYSGTNLKLQQPFAVIPKVGVAFSFNPFIIEVAYNYMDYGLYEFSPYFTSLGLGFTIDYVTKKTIYTPDWL